MNEITSDTTQGILSALDNDNLKRSIDSTKFIESVNIDKVFENGIILSKNGDVIELNNGVESVVTDHDYPIEFDSNKWTVQSAFTQTQPILSELDLIVDTNKLLITYPIYSKESITFNKSITIDVNSPFENAVVAKGDINFKKAEITGRVHSGNNIYAKHDLEVVGSIEAERDITVKGYLDVNYLDLVYKAAKISAHEHLDNPYLVWSGLFQKTTNKNGVGVFIYVNNALVDENKLEEIIAKKKENEYDFRTIIVDTSKSSGGVKEVVQGLLPIHKNKNILEKKLIDLGYQNLEIADAIYLFDKEFYYTYLSNGKEIGSFRVNGALSGEENKNGLFILSSGINDLEITKSTKKKEQEKKLNKHVIKLQEEGLLEKIVSNYREALEKKDKKSLETFSKLDKLVYNEFKKQNYWEHIQKKVDMPEKIFDLNRNSKQRGITSYAPSGKTQLFTNYPIPHMMSWVRGYGDWRTYFSITETPGSTLVGDRTYFYERTAIISTAMILKYADYSYGLSDKFDYSNNNSSGNRNNVYEYNTYTPRSGVDSTLKSRLNSIKTSFSNSGILINNYHKSVNSSGLENGILRNLNDRGVNHLSVEQIENKHGTNMFVNDAEFVIQQYGQPLILTTDNRYNTNHGHQYLNSVILSTYQYHYGYYRYSQIEVYDPWNENISWVVLDNEDTTINGDDFFYRYITFIRSY